MASETKGNGRRVDMISDSLNWAIWKSFEASTLAKFEFPYTQAPPPSPEKVITACRSNIYPSEIQSPNGFLRIVESTLSPLVRAVFAKGKPLGFYRPVHPSGERTSIVWQSQGVHMRTILAYSPIDDYVLRMDTYPIYDEDELKAALGSTQ